MYNLFYLKKNNKAMLSCLEKEKKNSYEMVGFYVSPFTFEEGLVVHERAVLRCSSYIMYTKHYHVLQLVNYSYVLSCI